MVKTLNFFIIRARTFKFSGNIDFGALITYMLKKFGFGGSDGFFYAPEMLTPSPNKSLSCFVPHKLCSIQMWIFMNHSHDI